MAEAPIIDYATTPERIEECPATPDRLINIKSPESSSSSCDDGGFCFRGRQRVGSPPPHCAICLEKCKSKCFTDSCLHQFCFKCLLEWSKIKAECPLCKQSFKSIIHNVKSIDQFEEYYVPPPESSIPVPRPIPPPIPSPPFTRIPSGRVQSGRLGGRRSSTFAQRFDVFLSDISTIGLLNRNGFSATVQVRPNDSEAFHQIFLQRNGENRSNNNEESIANTNVNNSNAASRLREQLQVICAMPGGSMGQMWRRFIYERKLYALPVADITGRFRECSASFYRENPAQIHRLMPWLNRDLVALLRDTEHHVSYVLNTISDLLTVYNISSGEFRRRCRPYLGQCTSLFIHEFLNFARSPYDMIGYDREVRYVTQNCPYLNLQDAADEAENGSDAQRSVSAEVIFSSRSEFSRFMLSSRMYDELQSHSYQALVDHLTSRSSAAGNLEGNQRSEPLINLTIESNDESNNAGEQSTQVLGQNNVIQINQNIVIDDISSSSDECEFVMERKPPHLRTPELVSLCTDSDNSDVVFVSETQNNNQPTTSGIASSSSSNIPTTTKWLGRGSIKDKSLIRVLSDSDSDSDTVLSQFRAKTINENGSVKTEPLITNPSHDDIKHEENDNNGSNNPKTQTENGGNMSTEATSSRGTSLRIKLPWKKQFLRRTSSLSSSSESSEDANKNKKLTKRKRNSRNNTIPKNEMPDIRNDISSTINVGASTSRGLYNPESDSYATKKYYARPVRQSRVKSQQNIKSIYEESSDSDIDCSKKKYSRTLERTDSDYSDKKSTKRKRKSSKKVKRSKSHCRKEHNNINKHRKDKRKKEKHQTQVKHKKSSRSKQRSLNKMSEYYSDSSFSSESYQSRSRSNSSESSSSSTLSRSRSRSFSPQTRKPVLEKNEDSDESSN